MQCCAVLAPRRVTKLSGSPEICCCLLACASQQWCEPLLVCIYVSGYIEITTRRDEVNDPGEGEKKRQIKELQMKTNYKKVIAHFSRTQLQGC